MPFARPTTTATPDEIFEEWVHVLGHAELLALLYVVRRTLGFKKATDSISYTQFLDGITTREGKVLDRGCGIKNRTTLAAALRRLEELRLIHSYKTQDARGDRATTRYGLWFVGDDAGDDDHATGDQSTNRAGDLPAALPTHDAGGGGTQAVPPRYALRTTGGTACVPPVVRRAYPQQTDLSSRAPRELPHSPSLDSTDSMVLSEHAVSTEQLADPDTSPLNAVVARFSAEFGDDAPQASRTRVLNIRRAAGLDEAVTLALLDEAATITRSQAAAITKRGRTGKVVRMPYLLATLGGLVEVTDDPTVAHAPITSDPILSPLEDATGPDVDDNPAPSTATVLWRAVLGEVRQDVTAENYTTWFAPTRALDVEGRVLRVSVPTPFHAQWLEHKLRGCVDRALGHMGRAGVRIAYEVGMPADRASVGDQAADQVAVLVPPTATIVPRPSASPREAPAFVRAPQPGAASSAVPPPVVACPSCRSSPCRCRLADQLRRVIAPRTPYAPIGASRVPQP